MAELPRLNGVIGALQQGRHALTTFTPADVEAAVALTTAKYDAVVYEMEHNAYDIRAFRDCLQYMLNRRQIAQSGSLAPAVAPFARIPPNGGEKSQFHAKQVLDLGAYGIIWPHVSTVEQAYNAVAACRYPRLKNKPLYEPAGEWRKQCGPWKGMCRPLFRTRDRKAPLTAVRFNTPVGARILRKILRYGGGGGVRFRCSTSAVETSSVSGNSKGEEVLR